MILCYIYAIYIEHTLVLLIYKTPSVISLLQTRHGHQNAFQQKTTIFLHMHMNSSSTCCYFIVREKCIQSSLLLFCYQSFFSMPNTRWSIFITILTNIFAHVYVETHITLNQNVLYLYRWILRRLTIIGSDMLYHFLEVWLYIEQWYL